MKNLLAAVLLLVAVNSAAQGLSYPYPVNYFNLQIEGQNVKMAFMDAKPPTANGETVLFLHGKNFNGYYWKDVVPFLTHAGYRVIVPDQVGWGKSSKPLIHYSFFMLANNTALLLDSLGISKVFVVGHSMGGMLATRFSLMFPQKVEKLVLENPIGLEDYSTFVPYKTVEELYKVEAKQTYESMKKYQQSYFPSWKPEYEQYVKAQAVQLKENNYKQTAMVNAITYQMIYEQPIVYNFYDLEVPTLLIIGQADRTVVGKSSLTEEQKKVYGNYPSLGRKTAAKIKGSQLVELPGVGHIPHIQQLDAFRQHLLAFLSEH